MLDIRYTRDGTDLVSSKIIKGATRKFYKGAPHGLCLAHKDQVSADLLAFFKA